MSDDHKVRIVGAVMCAQGVHAVWACRGCPLTWIETCEEAHAKFEREHEKAPEDFTRPTYETIVLGATRYIPDGCWE